ncbi:MAG: hypothetical protein QM757_14770 [Paludibaculum sp.]
MTAPTYQARLDRLAELLRHDRALVTPIPKLTTWSLPYRSFLTHDQREDSAPWVVVHRDEIAFLGDIDGLTKAHLVASMALPDVTTMKAAWLDAKAGHGDPDGARHVALTERSIVLATALLIARTEP